MSAEGTSIYVGIDNGISGGLCAMSVTPGAGIIGKAPMPTQKTRRGNEIDITAVWLWLTSTCPNLGVVAVAIEEPGGSKSAQAAASMAASFASIRAMCELKGLRYFRLTPQEWQKPMLKCGTGETKAAALTLARSLWPGESWLASDRCRTPHDGMIDAALITEHARRRSL